MSSTPWLFSAFLFLIGVGYLKDWFEAIIERKISANMYRSKWHFRDSQPFQFWAECVTYFLSGIGLIIFSLYMVRADIIEGVWFAINVFRF